MASSPDVIQFQAHYPELVKTVTDADIGNALDVADIWIDERVWARTADFLLARQLLAAHFLTLMLRQQMLGAAAGGGFGVAFSDANSFLNSIHFGERSVGFGQRTLTAGRSNSKAMALGEDLLMQTFYGMQFLQLRSRNVIPVMIV